MPGTPEGVTYFPPTTTGTGTTGFGSTTALVPTLGGGLIVTCSGTSFAASTTYAGFMSNPAGAGPSEYASTVVPGLVYVVGANGGTPVFSAYSQFASFPVFSVKSPGSTSAVLSAVTSGP